MSKDETAMFRKFRLDIILHILADDPKLQDQLKVLLCPAKE